MEVRSNVLQWARARSGIAAAEWDRRFPRYDGWLRGDAPTLKQLEDFAHKTHTPVGFLFLDEPPVEPVPIPDFRTVGDRAVGVDEVVSANLLDIIDTCQAWQEWYRDHQLLNGESPLNVVGSVALGAPVTDAAAMRDALGWDVDARRACRSWAEALTGLRDRAEVLGGLAPISGTVGLGSNRKLEPEEFRGFALADPCAPLVFVNGSDGKAAQVFTLAHELAHLWPGETALSDVEPTTARSNVVERWCNEVAAELLVPADEFRQVLVRGAEPREQLPSLAAYFRVSTQVLLGRFRELGILTWPQYLEELQKEHQRVAGMLAAEGRSGGNYYVTKPVQVSKRFARALVASTLEGQTSYTEAFRLLDLRTAATLDGLADRLGVERETPVGVASLLAGIGTAFLGLPFRVILSLPF